MQQHNTINQSTLATPTPATAVHSNQKYTVATPSCSKKSHSASLPSFSQSLPNNKTRTSSSSLNSNVDYNTQERINGSYQNNQSAIPQGLIAHFGDRLASLLANDKEMAGLLLASLMVGKHELIGTVAVHCTIEQQEAHSHAQHVQQSKNAENDERCMSNKLMNLS